MRVTLRIPLTLALAALCGAATAWTVAQPRAEDPPMGPAIFVGDTVLKPYDPHPALVTRVTRVDRPKYPVTDQRKKKGLRGRTGQNDRIEVAKS